MTKVKIENGMKACNTCGRAKGLNEFNRDARNKDGFEGICKECRSSQRQARKRVLDGVRFDALTNEEKITEMMVECDFSQTQAENLVLSGSPSLLPPHEPRERSVFECPHCGKLYKTKVGINNHMKTCFKNPDAWQIVSVKDEVFELERTTKHDVIWKAYWSVENGFLSFDKILPLAS
ncbi:hypothetical protein [Carboxylicivirga marina]|uniref:hypothetical protein n=1 Tax=Carboxylicivirga marina TaxID=2800988 RepID=UPI0025959BF2|nr:hypothetical protein [uncultured Carboxylicivirga sp.]